MENKSLDTFIKQHLEGFKVDIPSDWAFMEDMLNAEETTPVDENAKSQLQNMEVPFDASSWLAMEAALEELEEVNDVDEAAKSALEDFQVEYNPADWAMMGAILDAEMPNEIDELAKSALQNYTVPFVAMDWDMMDEALDDADFPHEIDEAAKAALRQYESTMPSDWAAMESALIEAEQVRRQLIITKSIELFLFIFAIWTIGNFLPFEPKSSNTIIYPIENVMDNNGNNDGNNDNLKNVELDKNQPQASESSTPTINNLSIVKPSSENSFDNQSLRNNINTGNVNPAITPKSQRSFELNLPIINPNNINAIPPRENQNKTNVETIDKPIATLETKAIEEVLVTYPNKKGKVFNQNNSANETTASLENANFLDTKSFALNVENTTTSRLQDYSLTKKSFYPLRMKGFVSPQYATFTNNTANYGKQKTASGISAGLGIDYAISNKFEIASGITYNHKSYTYREQKLFSNAYNQFTLSSIQDVKLSIMQVPIRVNYNIKKDDRIRLYAITGITAGVITKVIKSTQAASLANSVFNLQDNGGVEALSTNANNANSGILQNGSIHSSSFITVDAGLGLEYQTSGRYSFFIEPMFQHSLTKIGADEESYQNYGLSLGSRIIL
jgi:hypothetical protein